MSPALRLSLGANAALLTVVAWLLWRDRPPAAQLSPPPAPPAAAQSATSGADASSRESRPKPSDGGLTRPAIAQLERMGIARDTLINVLLETVNHHSTAQILALQKRYAPEPVPDREMRELARAFDAERIRAIKAAFGDDGYRAWDKDQKLRELNGARPPGDTLVMTDAEAEQAYRLQKEFDDKSRELQGMMEDGSADRADVGALQAQAQQNLDRELEQLLGPGRFNELRGNADPAKEVYQTYGALNPTPVQATAVLQAEQDHRDREAALAKRLSATPEDPAKVTAELKAISDAQDEKLRQVFGAEAYDRIKQQNDPAYQTLEKYASAWQLDSTQVQSVYATLHAFQDQAGLVRDAAQMREAAGQHVDWHAIDAAIEQARQQAMAGLQNVVGDERLWRLKQNGVLDLR